MVKIAIIIVLIVTVILGGTGCMFNHQQNETSPSLSANDLALLHMQEKYGETFTYAAPWGNSMTGTREFLVFCESIPQRTILVQVKHFKTKNPQYMDNYMAVRYEAETTAYFQRVAEEIFDDVIVHYQANTLCVSSDFSKETSFESFYDDPSTYLHVCIEVTDSSYVSASQFEEFFNQLNGSQGQIKVRIVVVEDDIFGTMEPEDFSLFLYKKKEIATIFGKTVAGSFCYDLSEGG